MHDTSWRAALELRLVPAWLMLFLSSLGLRPMTRWSLMISLHAFPLHAGKTILCHAKKHHHAKKLVVCCAKNTTH